MVLMMKSIDELKVLSFEELATVLRCTFLDAIREDKLGNTVTLVTEQLLKIGFDRGVEATLKNNPVRKAEGL